MRRIKIATEASKDLCRNFAPCIMHRASTDIALFAPYVKTKFKLKRIEWMIN